MFMTLYLVFDLVRGRVISHLALIRCVLGLIQSVSDNTNYRGRVEGIPFEILFTLN